MLYRIHLSIIALLLVTSCFGQEEEENLVRTSFQNYKSAILNDRGEEAVEFVDRRTISYYSEILEKTIHSDSASVDAMNIMDKLMILIIRVKTTKEDLLDFNGRELLVYAINEGMVGKNSVMNNDIGTVEIEGDYAKGQLMSNGEATPVYFIFNRENDNWKVDLTSIFELSSKAFQQMQQQSGMNENEYLLAIITILNGEEPANEIWHAIK